MKSLFQVGNFTLASGLTSSYKIECDVLTDQDWICLAWLLFNRLPLFSAIEGVPQGGLKLAEKMQKYKSAKGPLLIVDDVFTTGGSMRQLRGERDAIGAVVFARGPVDAWITPLFVLQS